MAASASALYQQNHPSTMPSDIAHTRYEYLYLNVFPTEGCVLFALFIYISLLPFYYLMLNF